VLQSVLVSRASPDISLAVWLPLETVVALVAGFVPEWSVPPMPGFVFEWPVPPMPGFVFEWPVPPVPALVPGCSVPPVLALVPEWWVPSVPALVPGCSVSGFRFEWPVSLGPRGQFGSGSGVPRALGVLFVSGVLSAWFVALGLGVLFVALPGPRAG